MNPANTTGHKPTIILILLISISIILISLNLTPKIVAIKNVLNYFLFPVPGLAFELKNQAEQLGGNISAFIKLNEENIMLKDRIEKFVHLENEYRTILQENTQLQEILRISKHINYDMISARIIVRNPSDWFRSVIIDKGYEDNIKSDMPVVAIVDAKETLVGRIFEVNKNTSKVLLITDGLSSVSVRAVRSETDGIIEGRGEPYLLLDYLLADSDIKIGDEIVTSGVGGIFPAGLPVGTVCEVFSEKKFYFKQAFVKTAIDLNKINIISVIVPIPLYQSPQDETGE